MVKSPRSLSERALRLVAIRDYTRTELERKLNVYVVDDPEQQAILERVLDNFAAKGFISETRVIESTLNGNKGKLGTARVIGQLRNRGVSEEGLVNAAQQLRETELERAQYAWRKKFEGIKVPDSGPAAATHYAKQMRFLMSRGFSGDIAYKVINSAGEQD
jgi:regulatory protein